MGKATDGLLKLFGGRRKGFVVTDPAGNARVVPFTTSTDVVRGDGTTGPAPTSGITQLTGDVTAGPGSGSQVATLAASGVTAGTYGDATHAPQVTVDAKGRVTAASDVAITFPSSADYVVMSDGHTPPAAMDDGAGNFLYVGYTP